MTSHTNLGLLASLFLYTAFAASVTHQVKLGEVDYFLPSAPAWSLSWSRNQTESQDDFLPLTVVHANETKLSAEIVKNAFARYNKTDDVWSPFFTETLYVQYTGKNKAEFEKDFDKNVDCEAVFFSKEFKDSEVHAVGDNHVPEGPYFLNTWNGNVHAAYRLYPDTHQAFVQSTYQDVSGTHHPLAAGVSSAGGLTIAVPSRLYNPPTDEKPLGGVRLAVKDLYDLKGVKTSFGSRAWFEQSLPASKTAVSVEILIKAGAVVVGKNKLSEFAHTSPYHMSHVDYLLPLNPRGDGYNSPGDSSGGSAASIAAYDWLDISMGSDTGGSIRGPAIQNGVHGNRPSQDAVDLTGAGIFSRSMDTSGLITRDPLLWGAANRVLYANTTRSYSSLPTKIYTGFDSVLASTYSSQIPPPPPPPPELNATYSAFLTSLSKLLHNARPTKVQIDTLWNSTAPAEFQRQGRSIANLTDSLYGNLTNYEQWVHIGKPFLDAYAAGHNGELPWVTPSTLNGWLKANKSINAATHAHDLQLKRTTAAWSEEHFLHRSDVSCSEAVFVYPFLPTVIPKLAISPDDENPYLKKFITDFTELEEMATTCQTKLNATMGIKPNGTAAIAEEQPVQMVPASRFASVAGLPDYVITLAAYEGPDTYSNISMVPQEIAYGVGLVAAKGCDFVIHEIVEGLVEMGVVKEVKTGRTIA